MDDALHIDYYKSIDSDCRFFHVQLGLFCKTGSACWTLVDSDIDVGGGRIKACQVVNRDHSNKILNIEMVSPDIIVDPSIKTCEGIFNAVCGCFVGVKLVDVSIHNVLNDYELFSFLS